MNPECNCLTRISPVPDLIPRHAARTLPNDLFLRPVRLPLPASGAPATPFPTTVTTGKNTSVEPRTATPDAQRRKCWSTCGTPLQEMPGQTTRVGRSTSVPSHCMRRPHDLVRAEMSHYRRSFSGTAYPTRTPARRGPELPQKPLLRAVYRPLTHAASPVDRPWQLLAMVACLRDAAIPAPGIQLSGRQAGPDLDRHPVRSNLRREKHMKHRRKR
jgi:hypothetical protein